MSSSTNHHIADYWQKHYPETEERLKTTFIHHAIDNRGVLTSARRSAMVVEPLSELVLKTLTGDADETEVSALVTKLAQQGLSIICGTRLMQTLTNLPWLKTAETELDEPLRTRLSGLQLAFMENLAYAHNLEQHRAQEKSQQALQLALQTQLEQQRHLRQEQEQYNETIRKILALNAKLASITNESELLDKACSGICQSLNLAHITLYELHIPENYWSLRTTTASDLNSYDIIPTSILSQLNETLHNHQEMITLHETDKKEQTLSAIMLLSAGDEVLGAMMSHSGVLTGTEPESLPILLRTFTQSLAALWRNLLLFAETKQRSLEMEILYGRYVDSIWNAETAALYASYSQNGLVIERQTADMPDVAAQGQTIPLFISNRPIGAIKLPPDAQLNDDEVDFTYALIREMGNALNNAYLLQTTRSTSNQLSLATEVSRAATTILDRDLLIKEVVAMIRASFNFYYVGLFLVDQEKNQAILQAGTGEAGRLQVERKHFQPIGSDSMIGTSIATGEALVEQDVTQAKTFKFNPLLPETRSELALPLRTRGRVIGALTVQSSEKGAFTGETTAVLQSLGDQLAIAIENAGLFAQTQATLAETSRLYQASRKISEANNRLDIYEALIEFARLSGLVDIAQINTVDPEIPEHLIVTSLWSRIDYTPPKRFPRPILPPDKQTRRDKILTIPHNAPAALENPLTQDLFKRYGIHFTYLIPIHTEERWLGTLSLHRTQVVPLTEQELQPFQTLIEQAAVALANQLFFEELREANDKLRQLDQLKTQFLANMSHELRTPLNSIIGFSRVILKGIDGPITDEQEEDLTSIHNNGQHLLSLINEILDMAKIEAGKMSLTFEPVDLVSSAKVAFSSIRTLVAKDVVELIWDVEEDLPFIEADSVRLRQILTNLLSNAAKYTNEGSIRLKIYREDENHVHVSVHDTGIGIAPEEFKVLFKAFEQVDSSTTREVGGTGLGLPITKWIVNMHQGEIWLESEVGRGTVSHVRLPIHRKQDKTEISFTESQTV